MPTIGKSVQFRGIDNAVNAYKNMEIPRWGLFQGSQFLMKYEGTSMNEGADLLKQYLDSLDLRSADTNTYTLCIYDSAEKINNATKYDASFNFRLADNIEEHNGAKLSGMLDQRITGIEKKLDAVLSPEEPEEETGQDKIFGALGRILEHPDIQQLIARKIIGIVDGLGNTMGSIFTPRPMPAAIGSAPTNADQENKKLQEAVNMLVEVDDKLGTNLLKLANIAKADPAKYKVMISMLNNM